MSALRAWVLRLGGLFHHEPTAPVLNPQQLVRLMTVRRNNETDDFFSYPTFQQLRDKNEVFSGVLALSGLEEIIVKIGSQRGVAKGQLVSGTYYETLGVDALEGRLIAPNDDQVGSAPVAVISYSYWIRRFNEDVSVTGNEIELNGSAFRIIGVTPPEFFSRKPHESSDVSIPITKIEMILPDFAMAASSYSIVTSAFRSWLYIMGRHRPSVTEDVALADLEPIFAQAQRQAAEELAGSPFDSPYNRRLLLEARLKLLPGRLAPRSRLRPSIRWSHCAMSEAEQ